MPRLRIGDVELNHRTVGSGPDLVLIHGLAANNAFWGLRIVGPLARTHRLTVYDLRGHGYSNVPPTNYTTTDMVGDLIGLLDGLGIGRAHLAGHSYGGAVALECAVMHPERVASITMIDARLRILQPTQRIQDTADWQWAVRVLGEEGLHVPDEEADIGLWLLEQLASPRWEDVRQRMAAETQFIPFGGWRAGQRSAERWLTLVRTTSARRDFLADGPLTVDHIRRLRHPLLALYGERSLCVETCHRLSKEVAGCRAVLVPEAGHFFPVAQPELVVAEMSAFLAALADASASRRWGT